MLDSLLRKGYFPQELPPLFSTNTFANCIHKNNSNLSGSFTANKATWTLPVYHNLARVGGLRRRLGIPNPVNFYRLSNLFEAHSPSLQNAWNTSPFSKTIPSLSSKGDRAISPQNSDRATPRILARTGGKYLLKADISQFYPSIYTHTIPWSIHTKAISKANIKNSKLYGNLIDKEVQACQYGQTKGVAIGPDTSLGIAELLLSDIDNKLKAQCNIKDGVRFIDDIELSFVKLADAENTLVTLEGLLYEYELQLNISKTKIVELPDTLESVYVTDLRIYLPLQTNSSRAQWIDFFNKAFLLAQEFPSDGVLRYALASIRKSQIKQKDWECVQNLLWQSVLNDSGTIRFIIDVLLENSSKLPLPINKNIAIDTLNLLITTSAAAGHGSEVVWAIWAALLFGLELPEESQDAILNMDDSFVAVAAMVANKHNVFKRVKSSNLWSGWLTKDCFDDSNWLFAYEAYRHGWMRNKVRLAELHKNPSCQFMKKAGVSFVDENMIKNYKPKPSKTFIVGTGGGY